MYKKISFIFVCSLIFLIMAHSSLYAQSSCEILESKLNMLKEKKAEAFASLEKNKRGLMQAQEILLLARAKGDVKAGRIAEEAIKEFEENISKNSYLIKEYEKEIANIENVIRLCKSDECQTIEAKIDRTRQLLKRAIKDVERQTQNYEELQKELETLKELQKELSSWDSRLDFVLNSLDVTGAFESVQLVKSLKNSIYLSVYSLGKDNIELVNTLKDEGERTARTLGEARSLAEEVSRDINLVRKFLDVELDITDLVSKINKAQNAFEKVIKLNNLLKVNEYIYKTLYINIGYDLLGEELSVKLYATDKMLEGIEALKRELKREMEICRTCKELGRLK